MEFKEKLSALSTSSGVYLMKDADGNIIYVGKAKNLKRRVNQYFSGREKDIKTYNLVNKIADFDYILTNSELDSLILENNLIKKYQPHYNILLKDDKNFPYIKINLKSEYPKLEVTRKIKRDGARYFGPYFAGVNINEILDIVNWAFNLRTCNFKFSENKPLARPCLNYSIGLCCAPCVKMVSKEEYNSRIKQAVNFLNGDTGEVEVILKKKMEIAGENLNFERALQLRESLKSLERLNQKYTTQFINIRDADFFGYYSNGMNACISVLLVRGGKVMGCENFNLLYADNYSESISQFIVQYYQTHRAIPGEIVVAEEIEGKEVLEEWLKNRGDKKIEIRSYKKQTKKELTDLANKNAKDYLEKSLSRQDAHTQKTIGACQRLKELLNLSGTPFRIECYDISHISGTNKVASMVVFLNGEPAKKHYRKFTIKTVEGSDDFACLKEVLTRRIGELGSDDISFGSRPNLLVIDGGKGQLSSTVSVLEELNEKIDIISLAKREEEIFLPKQSAPIVLKHTDIALQLLQRLRDEAHRFAITFHRNKRGKTMTKSELDEIAGLGEKRKKYLLKQLGSIENIKSADITELEKVKGITKKNAQDIFRHFQDKK